jgi:hypothetical protein
MKKKRQSDPLTQYQKSLLTYFDILGFRELIHDASEPEQVAARLRVFTRLSQPERAEMEKWQHTFAQFSDLAVRSVPIKPREDLGVEQGLLYWELLDLAHIQAHMIDDGVLIRGAMTVGDIYINERLIFGPALIRAYELESSVSVYPRVILDSRVFDRLADSPELRTPNVTDQIKSLSTIVTRDRDGIWFVDYLRASMYDLAGQPARYVEFLRRHRRVVQKAMAKCPELSGPAAKLGWLANYHNCALKLLKPEILERQGIRIADLAL